MQNIASIAKLAIQILSVLLLATIMGNKNRNTNTNTNNNNNNQNNTNSNSNNNNNVFILVMALPIGSDSSVGGIVGGSINNDDDVSYKDNTDILILSDINSSSSNSNSDSNINLSDGSGIGNSDNEDFDIENSETNGFLNDMIKNNNKIKSSSSSSRSSSSSIKKSITSISNNNSSNNNNKNSFNNNTNKNDKIYRINNIKRSIKSASEDFNIELTTTGYNPIIDNIENHFSTIDSKDTNINVADSIVADGDEIIDDDDENNEDDTDDDEQNIIFKDEIIRLGVSSNTNSESLKIDSQNITTSSKLSIDDNNNNKNSNINNNNNNNKNLLPLNIVIDKTTSTSLSSTTTTNTTQKNLANTGILNGPSTILQLDRNNSTQKLTNSTSILLSSSLSIPSENFLNDNNSKSSLTSHNSSSLSSTSNLILLSKNSYVPANIQQKNIPIENNLIALNANKENVATNIAIGIPNLNGIQTDSNFNNENNNNNNNDGTIVKTYLGMQSNITTTLLSSSSLSSISSQTSDKLLSSSLTAASASDLTSGINSGDKKLGYNPISSNINVNNIIEIGKTVGNDSSSISTSNNRHAGVGINISGHSGVVSSFSEAISSKLTLPKPQKTDAPMLNYIFDTYSAANKHHHHDQRYGPHFEDKREGNVTNITVQAGSTIHLNCRISLLQDKTVSWVKRNINDDEEALELLTVGGHTYTGDSRFTIDFQYPSNWRLKISNVRKSDEGQYECQISTHPPRVIQINLHVNAPKVIIVDEYGIPLQEKYYEIDSTLQLSCIVRNVVMSTSAVFWSHGDQVLNYDLTRGGVSVKTELMDDGANSTLFIAKINKSDSGNYTCSINQFHDYSIMVHILNGESFAELHHGNSSRLTSTVGIILYIVLLIFLLQFHQRNKIFLIIR